jgi:hypothetical protein
VTPFATTDDAFNLRELLFRLARQCRDRDLRGRLLDAGAVATDLLREMARLNAITAPVVVPSVPARPGLVLVGGTQCPP